MRPDDAGPDDARSDGSGYDNAGYDRSGAGGRWRDQQWSASETGRSGFSLRAERLLVRVLLVLRGEARPGAGSVVGQRHDRRRAEELADIILTDFPRRVMPFGIAALAIIVVLCTMPLMRDLLAGSGSRSGGVAPVANVVESSLRARSAEMSDGLEALKAVVAPFASDATPNAEAREPVAPCCDAAAPFKRS